MLEYASFLIQSYGLSFDLASDDRRPEQAIVKTSAPASNDDPGAHTTWSLRHAKKFKFFYAPPKGNDGYAVGFRHSPP
jgi:hypothetical protein